MQRRQGPLNDLQGLDATRAIVSRSATALPLKAPLESGSPARLEAIWARQDDDVRTAQALRWRVFVHETGACLRHRP